MLLQDINLHDLPLSVIMHYAWWLTQQSPTDGIEVFIRSPKAKDMDPDEVLEKLEGLNNQVVQTYLDYLVTKLKSQNPEYHTRLACSYANDIQDEMKASNGLESFRELGKNQSLH